ncbi:hypothetical protein P4O66_002180 [Electrophorus voltai]|uniref:Reverse transcriptase RNase H-like domain-containing protein n=1 Tax=Electrophorus voltai TaxID=2609070 RepID=A0AAD8Z464_9TELE|nr:hypothetical protein P4O66_002180 [Electrophorus voltai]
MTLNDRQARWSIFFSRFQFKVTYRPGEKNTRADTLSRQYTAEARPTSSEPVLSPTCFLASLEWELDQQIKAANPHPQSPTNRLYVPPAHRGTLITWAHILGDGSPSLHRATDWSTLLVACYAPRCMDLPVSEGNTTILSVVARFSKMVRFVPLVALPTALETAEMLFLQVFRQFGTCQTRTVSLTFPAHNHLSSDRRHLRLIYLYAYLYTHRPGGHPLFLMERIQKCDQIILRTPANQIRDDGGKRPNALAQASRSLLITHIARDNQEGQTEEWDFCEVSRALESRLIKGTVSTGYCPRKHSVTLIQLATVPFCLLGYLTVNRRETNNW